MIRITLNNGAIIETDKIEWIIEEARYAIVETGSEDIDYYTKECGVDANDLVQTIEENACCEFEDYVIEPYDSHPERKLTYAIVENGRINGEPTRGYMRIKKDMIKEIDIIGGAQ